MALFVIAVVALLLVSIVYSQSVYVGFSTFTNYDDAKSHCSDLSSFVSGQLATWGSSSEFDAIKLVRNEFSIAAWVGLDDITDEGNWKFVDGDMDYWY